MVFSIATGYKLTHTHTTCKIYNYAIYAARVLMFTVFKKNIYCKTESRWNIQYRILNTRTPRWLNDFLAIAYNLINTIHSSAQIRSKIWCMIPHTHTLSLNGISVFLFFVMVNGIESLTNIVTICISLIYFVYSSTSLQFLLVQL